MNRSEELKALLMLALDSPKGVITEVTEGEQNRRQVAIAALTAAKRELLPDFPELLNVQIRPMPGTESQIVIFKIPTP